jgi:nascent polypeptide-associated complex subunit beta
MSRGQVGSKTGGKGSWRRKGKKVSTTGNLEGQKVWATALRLGCRQFGQLDSASMLISGEDDALHFTKPELVLDMRSNTYILQGTPAKKPMVEVLQELFASFDPSKVDKEHGAAEEKPDEGGDDLGDIPDGIDFAAADEGTTPPEKSEPTENSTPTEKSEPTENSEAPAESS